MKKSIRELVKEEPSLWDYDYKWRDSKDYKPLDEALEEVGYKLVEEDEDEAGCYNDLKGYLSCEVEPL